MTSVHDQLRKLEGLASADAEGTPTAHGDFIKGIGDLLLAVETPIETTSRLNFQVCEIQQSLQLLCDSGIY